MAIDQSGQGHKACPWIRPPSGTGNCQQNKQMNTKICCIAAVGRSTICQFARNSQKKNHHTGENELEKG
jgi:hypothetical protein